MENLNAEQVIKALECCKTGQCHNGCPLLDFCNEQDVLAGSSKLCGDALDLINSQEQKIFELENRLKESENGYEATLHLESCKLHDAEEKVKKLTEENERLENICQSYALQYGTATDKEVFLKKERADTVRKMHSMLCEGRVSNDNVVIVASQVAKEMLEGEK